MGIVGFNDLFTASQVKVPKASSSHVFIDANLYWLKLRTHQMGARFANLTTSEFSAEFVDFVCADLLQFELLKSDDLYRQEARTIELIFDSKFSRNFMKMWRCYRRAETNVRTSKDVRVEADYAMLEYYLEELRAALHLRYSQYDENAVGLIKIKEAEMDTDEYIVSRCHQLLEQEEERGTRELVLVSPDSSLQNTFVSRISIFSDDTDFVSFFPSCQRAGVYSIRRSEYGESEVFLLNAAINHSHPVIKDLDELSDRLARTYSRIEREYVFRLALKVYAMLSANDYISCSFFDIRYLRQAFESVFLWYRGPLGVVKTPLPPRHPLKRKIDYCDDSETEAPETGANKRNVEAVADKRSVDSGEGPAKKRRVGERGESANVASTAIKAVDTAVRGAEAVDTAVRGAEAVDTAVRGAEELALIMNELPLTCVFAYWMCYLDGIKSDGAAARKHLALVNNILRIFIVQFTEPPVFTAEAALLKFVDGPLKEQPPETSGGGGLLSLDQKVSLSLFEFQNVSKTALTASAAPPARLLHTIEELDCALSNRWLTFFDRPFCSFLENNFKQLLSDSMRNSPSGLLPKENLTGALEVWSKMRSCFLQNKHICGLYDTDREVISSGTGRDSISCFLRICGHLTNYFVVFMIGLSRVWFFSEYKLLTQNLEMARKCEARRLSVSSQWFRLCSLAVYDFFMPCSRRGGFVVNLAETVSPGKKRAPAQPRAEKTQELVHGTNTYNFERFYENAIAHARQYI